MGGDFTLTTVLFYPTICRRDTVVVFLWLSIIFAGNLGILDWCSRGIVPSLGVSEGEVSRFVRLGMVVSRNRYGIFEPNWDLGRLLMRFSELSSAPRRPEFVAMCGFC